MIAQKEKVAKSLTFRISIFIPQSDVGPSGAHNCVLHALKNSGRCGNKCCLSTP